MNYSADERAKEALRLSTVFIQLIDRVSQESANIRLKDDDVIVCAKKVKYYTVLRKVQTLPYSGKVRASYF